MPVKTLCHGNLRTHICYRLSTLLARNLLGHNCPEIWSTGTLLFEYRSDLPEVKQISARPKVVARYVAEFEFLVGASSLDFIASK